MNTIETGQAAHIVLSTLLEWGAAHGAEDGPHLEGNEWLQRFLHGLRPMMRESR